MVFHELGSEQMRGVDRPSMQRIVGRSTTKQVPLPASPTVDLRSAPTLSPSLPDAPASTALGFAPVVDRKSMKHRENFSNRLSVAAGFGCDPAEPVDHLEPVAPRMGQEHLHGDVMVRRTDREEARRCLDLEAFEPVDQGLVDRDQRLGDVQHTSHGEE